MGGEDEKLHSKRVGNSTQLLQFAQKYSQLLLVKSDLTLNYHGNKPKNVKLHSKRVGNNENYTRHGWGTMKTTLDTGGEQ